MPGALISRAGISLVCVESLEGTLDPKKSVRQAMTLRVDSPPLLSRFMGCPPNPLFETDPMAGDGLPDVRVPTFRIWART